jgi:ABC-type sugar transport system substrate-binding protein
MKEAFSDDNGFDLVFNAADNDPAAQISAVRSFISQGVDAIVIAPIVEDGWDDVLQEAKDADIPVILEDRTVTSSDDLYASWVGLDFKKEGVTAGEWAAETFTEPTKMVVLEGTTGSAPANDRAEGFAEGIGDAPIETIDSQTGDFTRDGGKTVMEGFLQKYGVDGIDLVYAHNDDMALGAIEAIEAAGGTPGEDIRIVSIDAVKDGMQALVDGKISFIVECNPLLGEQAADLVKKVLDGGDVEKAYFVPDQSFTAEQAAEVIDSRPY